MGEVDFTVIEALGLRHGDVWMVKRVEKTVDYDSWIEPIDGPRLQRWYLVVVIEPPVGWPTPEYGFYRSQLRYGDLETLSEDEAMTNLRRLLYDKAPTKRYFSKHATRSSGHQLVWIRRVTTL